MNFKLAVVFLTILLVLDFTVFLPIGHSPAHIAFNAFAIPVAIFVISLVKNPATTYLLGFIGIILKRALEWVTWAFYADQWDDGAGFGVNVVFGVIEIVS